MSHENRKLPPYGKQSIELINNGWTNDIYIFVGMFAWKKAGAFIFSRPTLCLPPWEEPAKFNYPVSGFDVLIFDTSGADDSYINDLAYWLYNDAANMVRLVTYDLDVIRLEKE